VRKWIVIIALLQLQTINVFAGGILMEIARIPIFFEHFIEHQSEQSNLSLIDFINLHYGEQSKNHTNDHPRDNEELPLKSVAQHYNSFVMIFSKCPTIRAEFKVKIVAYPVRQKMGELQKLPIAIFQPPQ
jgi:hypothetical protein